MIKSLTVSTAFAVWAAFFALISLAPVPGHAAATAAEDMEEVVSGGVKLMCGKAESAADDEQSVRHWADSRGFKDLALKADDAQKWLVAFNTTGEPTTLKADKLFFFRAGTGEGPVLVAMIVDGRFCALSGAMSAKVWDELTDKAFGAGS